MAANKFATMLHNNTNKITLILIYAFLEWILILLLLLNSLFSFFIIKFSQFFGLNPPCFWCARIDPLFESENKNSYRNHLCELHSKEVSHLGFCSIHRKLAESHDLCEDCSSLSNLGFRKESKKFVFSKVERIDVIRNDEEEDEVRLKCSCCGVDFETKFADDSSCFVIHPDVLDDAKKGNLIDDHEVEIVSDERIESNIMEENQEIEEVETEEPEIEVIRDSNVLEQDLIQFEKEEDSISAIQDLQFFIDYSGNQLFPFELLNSKTEQNPKVSEDEDHEFGDFQKARVKSEEIDESVHQKTEEHPKISKDEDHEFGDFQKSQMKSKEIDESVYQKTEESPKYVEDEDHEFGDFQKSQVKSEDIDESVYQKTEESPKFNEKSFVYHENLIDFTDEQIAIDEETQIPSVDNEELQESDSDLHSEEEEEEEEVSIGTEIPVLDSCDEIKPKEHSIISDNFHPNIENAVENFDEIGEEKAPETPSSIYSLNPLHKKWLIPEPKESGTEESFDGSTISETDFSDPMNTSEKLKSALQAERKTLHHLYLELEEERNASAVAANETMAMINRLQEEKAAMQMEALQYQRMMEEQSEYDHEALQLLNELMMKKETELELYRKKVSEYESKEKMRFSGSWSHSEDDDGLSVDFNRESQHQNTPVNSVFDLESFEEERVSILEQLKVLEEKLFALSDEEDRHFAKVSIIEDHYEEITNNNINGPIVEFMQNGKQPMGKSLLPLFDAISTGGENGITVRNGYEIGFQPTKFEETAVTRFELEKKRIDMEEEVDQLYGRLQALEADKEFLKHFIGSMKKGDKGMELLQEILQHLRDLRTKSYNDNVFI